MITHIGSINVDYNILNERLPEVGETTFGTVQIDIGGKGGNQISASSRLGAETCFISMLGEDDGNLDLIRRDLAWSGLSDEHIGMAPGMCGSAFLMVDDDARNYIVICKAADRYITPEFLDTKKEQIQSANVVVTEFMVPLDACEYGMKLAREAGAITLVNPAPVCEISDSFYQLMDVITPNEVETAQYVGFEIDGEAAAKKAADFFHSKGVKNVVLTLGSAGAFVSDGQKSEMVPSYKVNAIDTSGAGDTFNGALAYALDKGHDIFTSTKFANAASSVAVQKRGAVKANPTMDEVLPIFQLPEL